LVPRLGRSIGGTSDEQANKKSAHRKDHQHQAAAAPDRSAAPDGAEAGPPKKMKRKKYEREMRIL
jgi:hypothetical protein